MEFNRDISSRYRTTQGTGAKKSTHIPVNVADTPVAKKPAKKRKKINKKILAVGAVILLALVGSFFGGMQYQKTVSSRQDHKENKSQEKNSAQKVKNGKVSAVDQSSITIKDRENHESTYAITETTRIRNKGVNAAVEDIKINDNAVVYVNPDNDDIAAVIVVASTAKAPETNSGSPAQ